MLNAFPEQPTIQYPIQFTTHSISFSLNHLLSLLLIQSITQIVVHTISHSIRHLYSIHSYHSISYKVSYSSDYAIFHSTTLLTAHSTTYSIGPLAGVDRYCPMCLSVLSDISHQFLQLFLLGTGEASSPALVALDAS